MGFMLELYFGIMETKMETTIQGYTIHKAISTAPGVKPLPPPKRAYEVEKRMETKLRLQWGLCWICVYKIPIQSPLIPTYCHSSAQTPGIGAAACSVKQRTV